MPPFIQRQLFNSEDIGRDLVCSCGLLGVIQKLLPLSLIGDSLCIFLYAKKEMLHIAIDERSVPLLDYIMCANLHLLIVLQYISVNEMK